MSPLRFINHIPWSSGVVAHIHKDIYVEIFIDTLAKLETEGKLENSNMCKLNNKLNSRWGKEDITWEIRRCFEMNKNPTYQNL